MEIFIDKPKETEQLRDSDLQKLGCDLRDYINLYCKYIFVNDQIEYDAINRIKLISNLLLTRRYDQLFDHPERIIFDYYDDDPPWD